MISKRNPLPALCLLRASNDRAQNGDVVIISTVAATENEDGAAFPLALAYLHLDMHEIPYRSKEIGANG